MKEEIQPDWMNAAKSKQNTGSIPAPPVRNIKPEVSTPRQEVQVPPVAPPRITPHLEPVKAVRHEPTVALSTRSDKTVQTFLSPEIYKKLLQVAYLSDDNHVAAGTLTAVVAEALQGIDVSVDSFRALAGTFVNHEAESDLRAFSVRIPNSLYQQIKHVTTMLKIEDNLRVSIRAVIAHAIETYLVRNF